MRFFSPFFSIKTICQLNPMAIFRYVSNRSKDLELGFGKNITTEGRMMNTDGSFNSRRQSIQLGDNIYYHLIRMSWWRFFMLVFAIYLLLNAVFALLYCMSGIEHLQGIVGGTFAHDFTEAYFFSTQTLTTVGYGRMNPVGLPANVLAALESFIGLLAFSLISGVLYGRFSRPLAKIVFSENLLVSPYRAGQALMLRLANARKSELLETEAQMVIALNQPDDNGHLVRRFFPLELEIAKISFFPLSWTIVHPLNDKSPMYGFTDKDLLECKAEIMILVKGTDETNQQVLHARCSYTADQVIWNARFRPVIGHNSSTLPLLMIRQIGEFEEMALEL